MSNPSKKVSKPRVFKPESSSKYESRSTKKKSETINTSFSSLKPTPPPTNNRISYPRITINDFGSKIIKEKTILNVQNYKEFSKRYVSSLSTVYFVEDKRTHKRYAAKCSNRGMNEDEMIQVLREIKILMKYQHPTIINFEGVSFIDLEGNDRITIFTEYAKNKSLANLINMANKSLLPIDFYETNWQIILVGISYAMMMLHQNNVINRDLKAENVLIDDKYRPRLVDFGLSKEFDPSNPYYQSCNPGTIQYMAPEVFKDEQFSMKVDVYSFGILMYEVVNRKRAYLDIYIEKGKFKGDFYIQKHVTEDGLRPRFDDNIEINENIKNLITQCWSQNPNDRPTFSEIYYKLSLSQNKSEDYLLDESVEYDEVAEYVEYITNEVIIDDESETDSIKEQIKQLEKYNKEMTEKNEALTQTNSQLNKDKMQLTNENQKLIKDKKQLTNEIEQLKKDKIQIKNDNLQLKKDCVELKEEISKLKEEISKLKHNSNNFDLEKSKHTDKNIEKAEQINQKEISQEYLLKQCQEIKRRVMDGTLTTVELPQFLQKIPDSFFKDCDKLKSIKIPSYVTSIGKYAFSNCKSLTQITIPSSVTEIRKEAFSDCKSLTQITIPSSVTSIGEYAFDQCSSLAQVTFTTPSFLTFINKGVFAGCSSLTQITIPSSVTNIGESVFFGCSSLTQITIPSSVTNIGSNTFQNCESIAQIKFIIPSSITSIEYSAFRSSSLTQITIPSSVTSIGEYAFYDCESLTQIKFIIPSSVTSIGEYAFFGCKSLTQIIIPSSVTLIGKFAFYYCESLTQIIIPSSVTSIEEYSFCSCSSLTQITIPSSITKIGNSAFSNCSSLTQVSIPSSVSEIGNSILSSCQKLERILINECKEKRIKYIEDKYLIFKTNANSKFFDSLVYVKASVKSITIPSFISKINGGVFSCFSSLTQITIPSSVTEIGDDAFRDCSSLTQIIFTNPSFITSIGDGSFIGCSSLSQITIPSSVTKIGPSAFSACESLMQITIPSSVTSIGDHAFNGCVSLTQIAIPSSVKYIGYDAFNRCSSLTQITIPSSIERSNLEIPFGTKIILI